MTAPQNRLFIIFCVFLLAANLTDYSAAETPSVGGRRFVKIDERQLANGNHHDLAFDGTQWHIASGLHRFWWNYDANFSLLGTTTVEEVDDMRGLAFNASANQLVVGDQNTGVVRFVELDGTVSDLFATGHNSLEGLDYDSRDATVWLALFDGRIQQWSSQGELIFSFYGLESLPLSHGWSSVAIDPTTNHLFAMHNEDEVYEFTMSGQLLGKILDDPFPPGNSYLDNGLGLHFDPNTMLLRATSQGGVLVTFRLVPEPTSRVLMIVPALLLLGFVRSRLPLSLPSAAHALALPVPDEIQKKKGDAALFHSSISVASSRGGRVGGGLIRDVAVWRCAVAIARRPVGCRDGWPGVRRRARRRFVVC